MLKSLTDMTLLPGRGQIRVCGCKTFHTRIGGHEVWSYDYCLREMGLCKAAVQLAMVMYQFNMERLRGDS